MLISYSPSFTGATTTLVANTLIILCTSHRKAEKRSSQFVHLSTSAIPACCLKPGNTIAVFTYRDIFLLVEMSLTWVTSLHFILG